MTEPAELIEAVAQAICIYASDGDPKQCGCPSGQCKGSVHARFLAAAAIAAVRAYDEANQARADEPATERAPPADGWEAF